MLTRNIFYLWCTSLLFIGCSRTFAPSGWLPETDEYPEDVYGGWITLVVSQELSDGQKELYEYKGEFIAADEDNVYLLADSAYTVRKSAVISALLELTQKNTGTYIGWGAAFLLTPIINGAYSIFTGSFGIIAGASAASGESARDRYESDSPDNSYWGKIQKFARFPQGIPEGIDFNRLKSKFDLTYGD